MEQFVGKKVGDSLSLPANALVDLQPDVMATEYSFNITIEHVMKSNHIAANDIAHSFDAKSESALHAKLIEVCLISQ